MSTFQNFFDRFLSVEKRTGAIGKKFDGVQLYPLLRVRIYYSIATQLGLFDDPHPSQSSTEKKQAKPFAGFENLELQQTPVVVLPFKRKIGATDPYSDRIIELLRAGDPRLPGSNLSANLRVLQFEGDDDSNPSIERVRAWAKETFMKQTRAKIRNQRWIEGKTKRWNEILDAFESEFGVSLDKVRAYPPNALGISFNDGAGFEQYFRAIGAKHLYIVNAYSETSIVTGARRAGVKVHEIQHGFVTNLHPAYAYPKRFGLRQRVQHAPDSLLTWGSFWTDGVNLPAGVKPIVTGPTAAFIDFRKRVLAANKRKPKSVLFTSQGAVGSALVNAALETAKTMPDHEVIYRLHPNESLDDYRKLVSAWGKAPKNFSLSHRDPIFLELVSQSEYLVGAFSTTLYEGLALGCKVLVLKLPGYEQVQAAVNLGDMTLVDTLEELPNYLAKAKPATDTSRYYA